MDAESDVNEAEDLLLTTSSENGALGEQGSRICSVAASRVPSLLLNAPVYGFVLPSTAWVVRGGGAAYPAACRDLRRTVLQVSMTIEFLWTRLGEFRLYAVPKAQGLFVDLPRTTAS